MKAELFFNEDSVNYGFEKLLCVIKGKYHLENTEITASRIFMRIKFKIISMRIEIIGASKLLIPFFYKIIILRTQRTEINSDMTTLKEIFLKSLGGSII